MPADQIIVIRHAQKPTHKPKHVGIREDGTADPESLTVRGWQHAGALAAVFAGPGLGKADALVARPDVILPPGRKKRRHGSMARRWKAAATAGARFRL